MTNTDELEDWDSDAALDVQYCSLIGAAFYLLCFVCGVAYEVCR